MKKHASSHGLAVLFCTIAAGILIKMGRDYYPVMALRMEKFSTYIVTTFDLDYSPRAVSTLMLAVVFAVIWGIAFSFMHSDKKSDR